ncbi:MAG: peptidoglycan editing factor PgeF [Lachnospiraceae bacterium]|nr:peptidoglycan editing factor PgeF [Lachnospiraceae bacterium]
MGIEETIKFQRKKRDAEVLRVNMKNDVPYLTFPQLDACEKIAHLYTTRLGGVSEGQFRSMNFSIHLGDSPENVRENYSRIAKILGSELKDITGTVQTHTTNIRRVTEEDRGKVAYIPADYGDVDGLVTNVKGIVLAAFTADCVPIYFVDPVRECIGLAHSGWRGTVNDMAGNMVRRMQAEFGTDPKDLIVAIGPSICQDCYEVGDEVAQAALNAVGEAEELRELIGKANPGYMYQQGKLRHYLEPGLETGKYQLDLWLVNMIFLVKAGVLPERIDVTDLCTAENKELLFSHRASHGKRGNMGAFLKLKEE